MLIFVYVLDKNCDWMMILKYFALNGNRTLNFVFFHIKLLELRNSLK